MSEWSDQERVLPDTAAEPGKWRTSRTPYLREPLDCISDERNEEIVLMFSTQVGKTELLLNAIGYHIHLDPCPMLLVEPDLNVAETVSKQRIAAMIRDTPVLRGKVRDPRTRDSGNTLLEKEFPGGYLVLAGSNSPASLANRPVRKLFLDEIDRYALSAGTEGSPSSLAEKRTDSFEHSKQIIRVSSPSRTEGDTITSHFNRSDKRRYLVPCPQCKHAQILKFGNFKYETEKNSEGKAQVIRNSVRLICAGCKFEIDESEKSQMLQSGVWRAEEKFRGIAGFWINEFYSPWKPWWRVLQDYESKKDKPLELRVFMNTSLAELVEERGEAPDWKKLFERREKYKVGTVPYGPLILTAGVDVQRDRIEVEVVGWAKGFENWSIDYRVFEGDTSVEDSEVWQKLGEFLNTPFDHESGQQLSIKMMAVDSGFRTSTVYKWVRKWPRSRVIAIKGRESLPTIAAHPKAMDLKHNGKVSRRGMKFWPVGTTVAKEELYGWLNRREESEENSSKAGVCHFPEHEEEYFKQITAEEQTLKILRGSPTWVWVKRHERNEALDCRVYARAAAYAFGLDRWNAEKWSDAASAIPSVAPKVEPIAVKPIAVPVTQPVRRKKSDWLG